MIFSILLQFLSSHFIYRKWAVSAGVEQGTRKTVWKQSQKLVWKILHHDSGHGQRVSILEPPSWYSGNEDWPFMLKYRVFWFPQLCNSKGFFLFYFLCFHPFSRGHRNVFNHNLQYRMLTPVESWSFLSPKSSFEFVLFLAGSISQSTLQLSGQDF